VSKKPIHIRSTVASDQLSTGLRAVLDAADRLRALSPSRGLVSSSATALSACVAVADLVHAGEDLLALLLELADGR
jgi:hypothetical protein